MNMIGIRRRPPSHSTATLDRQPGTWSWRYATRVRSWPARRNAYARGFWHGWAAASLVATLFVLAGIACGVIP